VAQAFLWTPTDGMINLGTLGGDSSGAADVNEKQWVVGGSRTLNTNGHAFLWTATDGMVDLGTFGGPMSTAAAVNDRGQVVGSSQDQFTLLGFVWTETTGMIELPPLPGYSVSEGHLVSNGGYVVGTSLEGNTNRPTLWLAPPPPDIDDWTFCAPEGGVCAFSGRMEVRYGANGSFVVKTLTNDTACTNKVFGDPAPGVGQELFSSTDCPVMPVGIRAFPQRRRAGAFLSAGAFGEGGSPRASRSSSHTKKRSNASSTACGASSAR
jgi:probable HAF family extracellular repeat protein